MKNMKRTLTIGLIWSLLLLGWWFPLFLLINWNFNPYSVKDWQFLNAEFQSGWILDSTSDWFFLFTMILILPIWVLGWHFCLKVEWKKLCKTLWNKMVYFFRAKTTSNKNQKTKFKPKQSHKKVRPQPMNTSPKALAQAAKAEEVKQSKKAQPISQNHTPAFLTEEALETPLDAIELPSITRLEEDLLGILQKAGYRVIQGPTIGKKQFDYLAMDKEKILLCLTDTEKGDWLVDEESFGDEAPLWFSETAHRSSPIFEMADIVKSFSEKLNKRNLSYQIIPIFIEKAGNIINADEMESVWKKLGVLVCRTDLGGPEELPGFTQSVPPAADPIPELNFKALQDLL